MVKRISLLVLVILLWPSDATGQEWKDIFRKGTGVIAGSEKYQREKLALEYRRADQALGAEITRIAIEKRRVERERYAQGRRVRDRKVREAIEAPFIQQLDALSDQSFELTQRRRELSLAYQMAREESRERSARRQSFWRLVESISKGMRR
ncbi:MAG TPA: hypothetical protein VJZ52_01445 [Candidatus Paceibacterota bacterium]|nr:hypothetical protein [Candidatus Paceibacterota bacterium]